jgi:rhamnogalacturonyl hydrolase YesR
MKTSNGVTKIGAVWGLGTLVAGCASTYASGATRPAEQVPQARALSDEIQREAVVQAMTVVAEWQLANPSEHKPYEWHVAPFWASLVAFAPLSEDRDRYLAAVRRNGAANEWEPGPRPFLADDHAITQSYFLLYNIERDQRMIAPALARFDEMLRTSFDESLEFSSEKTSREWVWCDALFMSPPALALATQATGNRRYADLMNRLWWKTTDYLYDQEEHLYYRDSRFFSQRESNGRKVFWSRGNGWVLAGLARVLQYLPADYPSRRRFVALFQAMSQTISGLQGADGYWRSSLLDPDSRPGPETSGTGFYTYALAWGVNEGLLDRATYEPVVRKGWSALVRAVQPSGMLGYVQRVGDRPGETGPERTEIYGAGAFLLAGTEVYRLALR